MKSARRNRNSKQRQAIADLLSSGMLSHPTADEVFAALRASDVKMSLGTVYRNLAALSGRGEIVRLSGAEDSDRFDCDTRAHAHFKCSHCSKIYDLPLSTFGLKKLEQNGFKVQSANVIVCGVCPNCAKKFNTDTTKLTTGETK